MAVGDVTMPLMHVVQGVKIGSTEAYVRYPNRRDLVIFEFAEGSNVAGVFTQSAFAAAPVLLRTCLRSPDSRPYGVKNGLDRQPGRNAHLQLVNCASSAV